jgi:DNA adenine methylase
MDASWCAGGFVPELDEDLLEQLRELRDQLAQAEAVGDEVELGVARGRVGELVGSRVLGQLLATAQVRLAPAGPLRLPIPYYGGKFAAAPLIERAMGPIVNLVIPFGGSLGCLLGRSEPARVETANDKDGLIVNAWRAIKYAPFAVAEACALPVHELTLDAVHGELLERRASLAKLLRSDPLAYDVRAAAYWLWGRSVWLGGGWCNAGKDGRPRKAKVALRGGDSGPGIGQGVLSSKIRDELPAYFTALAHRLRHVRMTCGDWTRVLSRSVTVRHGVTGVYLDPCYDLGTGRKPELYGLDEPEQSAEVRAWALEHGEHPRMRIVLSGLADEHAELEEHGWSVAAWRGRERLWLSPGCLVEDFGPLFAKGAAA